MNYGYDLLVHTYCVAGKLNFKKSIRCIQNCNLNSFLFLTESCFITSPFVVDPYLLGLRIPEGLIPFVFLRKEKNHAAL
ncbi:hypothetical protein GCM10022397_00010 [Flavivirga jejuensis]